MRKIIVFFGILALMACKSENKTEEAATVEPTETTQEELVEYAFNPEKTLIKWTAFKTPEKIAVQCQFNEFEVNNTKTSIIPEDVLDGATFTIKTSSMSSGDSSRDAKIIGLFFNNLTTPDITGKFGDLNNKIAPVTLNMNGTEVIKEFSYTFENKTMIITGNIDIIKDFGANQAFEILSDACSQLHDGKTWSDVSIEVLTQL